MANGKKFLQIVGIVMIVMGAIGTVVDLIAFLGVLLGGAIVAAVAGVTPIVSILTVLLALLSAIILLIAGIIGVKNCGDVSKAQVCMTWGIIVIASNVVCNILFPLITAQKPGILAALIGLILPGLFIYGAIQNKNS